MTTIICNNEIMCADSQQAGDYIDQLNGKKIHKVNDLLVGCAGDAGDAFAFIDWIKAGQDKALFPKNISERFEALTLDVSGNIRYYADKPYAIEVGDLSAIGSGARFAMGAAMAGKFLWEAVEIACKLDTLSGGEVLTFDRSECRGLEKPFKSVT